MEQTDDHEQRLFQKRPSRFPYPDNGPDRQPMKIIARGGNGTTVRFSNANF